MSALQAPITTAPTNPAPLRAVPNKTSQIARLPFVLIIAILLGGGMTGVLLLSTTIQTQSSELIALQTREAELRYLESALVAQVQDLRSSQKLAERAWELGLRPNPNPAFIQMPSGQVVGIPTTVNGDELGGLVPPQAAAARTAAAEAAAAQAAAAQAAEAAAAQAAEAAAAAAAAGPPGPGESTQGTGGETRTSAEPGAAHPGEPAPAGPATTPETP